MVKPLELDYRCVTICLRLVDAERAISDERLSEFDPVEEAIDLDTVKHFASCQVMSSRCFEQFLVLVLAVDFVGS